MSLHVVKTKNKQNWSFAAFSPFSYVTEYVESQCWSYAVMPVSSQRWTTASTNQPSLQWVQFHTENGFQKQRNVVGSKYNIQWLKHFSETAMSQLYEECWGDSCVCCTCIRLFSMNVYCLPAKPGKRQTCRYGIDNVPRAMWRSRTQSW